MISKIKGFVCNRLFIGYSIIGLSGVILDFVSYTILIAMGVPPVLATILSTTIGITNNFLLNSFFNFKKRDRMLVRFIKFYSTGVVGIIITTALIYMLHDVIGVDPIIAKIITIPPVVAIQYFLNRNISFSDKSTRLYVARVVDKINTIIRNRN